MRISILLALALCLVVNVPQARADDAETIAAVSKAMAALDQAFEHQDAGAIKAMLTSDHVAVTPYYDGPKSAAAQIASLPDLKYEQTIVGEAKVAMLGADAAIRTFEARLDGTFKGKTISPRAFVTSIMVKEGGTWREIFYQVTGTDAVSWGVESRPRCAPAATVRRGPDGLRSPSLA